MKLRNTLSAIGLMTLASTSFASVNIHTFSPTANSTYIFTEDALSDNWYSKNNTGLLISAFYDMIDDPLVELNSARTHRKGTLVENMQSLSLTAGYRLTTRLQLGLSTAITMARMPDNSSTTGLNDSRVFAKYRLTKNNALVDVAVMPQMWIPTGNRSIFVSNDSFAGGLMVVAERDFKRVLVSANAGIKHSPRAQFRDLDLRTTLPLSLGAYVPITSHWGVNGDVSGEMTLPLNTHQNPSSAYLGGKYNSLGGVAVSFGGAVGSVNGYGSADYRIIAGLTLTPWTRKKAEEPAVMPMVVSAVKKEPVVEFTAKELVVREEVKFEHNKAVLTPSGQALLDEVARVMKENDKNFSKIIIEGHTNEIGSLSHNQTLSEQRAASVLEYLVSRGVAAQKLESIGFGKTKPKNLPGLSRDARLAADRRVEFKVIQNNLASNQNSEQGTNH